MKEHIQHIYGQLRSKMKKVNMQKQTDEVPSKDHSEKKMLVLLFLRIFAAIVAMVISSAVAIPGYVTVLICVALFVLTGLEAIRNAWLALLDGKYLNRYLLFILVGILAFSLGREYDAVILMMLFLFWENISGYLVRDGQKTICEAESDESVKRTVLLGGIPHSIDEGRICVGDELLVNTGESIPMDSVLLDDDGVFDLSALTGSHAPVHLSAGSTIYGGSLNLGSPLRIRTVKAKETSLLVRNRRRIEAALHEETSFEKKMAASAKLYAGIGVVLALIVGILVPLLFRASFAECLRRAGCILLVTSPFILTATIPYTVFAGIGGIAKRGAFLTGTESLSALAAVTTVAADLNGAFSSDEYRIVEMRPYSGTEKELLDLAAAASADIPFAQCLKDACGTPSVSGYVSQKHFPGLGVSTVYEDRIVTVGFGGLMRELGITDARVSDSNLSIYVAADDVLLGEIRFATELRRDAAMLCTQLKEAGINRTVLLSDLDLAETKNYASRIGVSEYYADCTPAKKNEKIRSLQAMQLPGEKLAFIGTGRGDASLCAEADISFVPYDRHSSQDEHDAVLMLSNDAALPSRVLLTAFDTVRTLRINYTAALICKGLLLIGALFGLVAFWLPPLVDMLLHFAALLGAMRVYDPDHFDPNLRRRVVNSGKKLLGSGMAIPDASGTVEEADPDEVRKYRAERKAQLFRSHK